MLVQIRSMVVQSTVLVCEMDIGNRIDTIHQLSISCCWVWTSSELPSLPKLLDSISSICGVMLPQPSGVLSCGVLFFWLLRPPLCEEAAVEWGTVSAVQPRTQRNTFPHCVQTPAKIKHPAQYKELWVTLESMDNMVAQQCRQQLVEY